MGVLDRLPGLAGGDDAAQDQSTGAEGDDEASGGPAADEPPTPTADPAAMGPADYRDRAEALAARSNVPTLDFTVASLEKLDTMAGGPTAPVEDPVALGSYLGETLVRAYDGTWVRDDGSAVAVDLGADETTVAVFDAAHMALEQGPVFQDVAGRLESEGARQIEGTPPAHREVEATGTGSVAPAPTGEPEGTTDEGEHGTGADAATGAGPTDETEDEADDGHDEDGETPVAQGEGEQPADADDAKSVQAGGSSPDEDEGRDAGVVGEEGEEEDGGGPAEEDVEPPTAPSDVDVTEPAADAEPVAAVDGPDPAGEESRDGESTDVESARPEDVPDGEEPPPSDESEQAGDATEHAADEPAAGDTADAATAPVDDGREQPAATGTDEGDGTESAGDESDDGTEDDVHPALDVTVDEIEVDEADVPGSPVDPGSLPGSSVTVGEGAGAATDDRSGEDDPVGEDAAEDDPVDGDAVGDGTDGDEMDEDAVGDGTDEDETDGAPAATESRSPPAEVTGPAEEGIDADSPDVAADVADRATAGDADAEAPPDGEAGPDPSPSTEPDADEAESPASAASAGSSGATEADEAGGDRAGTTDDGSAPVDGSAPDDGSTPGEEPSPDDGPIPAGDEPRPADAGPPPSRVAGDDGESVPLPEDGREDALENLAAEVSGPSLPPRPELKRAAREFADAWPDREFDRSPSSLARLDVFLDDQWDGRFNRGSLADESPHPRDGLQPLARVGAYVGQVLVEHLDSEWIPTEDGEGAVAVDGRGDAVEEVPVFDVARECMTGESTLAYQFDALANRVGADASARDVADVFDVRDERADSTAVIPAILDRAEAFTERWPAAGLDYAPASLPRLDGLVDEAFDVADRSGVHVGEATDPDSLLLTERVTAAAAYYATVCVNHLDANWRIEGEVALVVEGPAGSQTVDPVSVAAGAIRGEDTFAGHFRRLAERVGRESAVPE